MWHISRTRLCGILCLLLFTEPLWAAENRLSQEMSPYLLQHAHNPVDWYPWGDAAFARARRENRLIFLSVGYSTCHWCHVMAHESFEDEEVAGLLNQHFIAIKVDREERPDIDQVYMQAAVAMSGSGGWPLTVILTPDRVPVFAGTYFPKENRYGRPGLLELLPQLAEQWRQHPEQLRRSGRQLLARLNQARPAGSIDLGPELFDRATELLRSNFDPRHGGFGTAPKFPRPHTLTFLLRRYRQTGNLPLLKMAEKTLTGMRQGGIYDHLGGGFHRYSTDRQWLVPHFEKMLYDQAGLSLAYLEAYQVTGKELYAATLRETLAYVLRDLSRPQGGFYAAEDADSEGVEGKYYLWSESEVRSLLDPRSAPDFLAAYQVEKEGNFKADIRGELPGMNILHLAGMENPQDIGVLADSRVKLLEARTRRIRPHLDDKVLTAWNGLMISALARAGRVLDEPAYLAAAGDAAIFILQQMRDKQGHLLRRWRKGEAAIGGFAEDYAFFSRGLLDLYRADFDPRWLELSLQFAEQLAARFASPDGGVYDTASDAEPLISRPQALFDGALPSANSVALEVYARLYLLTGEPVWEKRARQLLSAFSIKLARYPSRYTQLLQGAMLLLEPTRQVVLVGAASDEATQSLLRSLQGAYLPETSLLLLPPGPAGERLASLAPHSEGMRMIKGEPTVYICRNFSCQQPLTDATVVRARLRQPPKKIPAGY